MRAKLQQAIALHQQGNLADAEPLYREVLAEAPEHPVALHLLGVVTAQRKRHEEALRLIDQALAIEPGYAAALRNRGNLLRELNRLEEALASYDRALAIDPDHAEAYHGRGVALKELNRPEEALASYDRALAIKPDHAEVLSNRGNALKALNRPEQALANYDRALAIQPDHAETLNNRGATLRELSRLEDALASYDRALAIRPDYAEVLSNRGAVLHELSRLEEAVASYDRALAIKPDYVGALYNRGNALKGLNRLDEALASYDRALAIEPDHAEAHWNACRCRLLAGDFARGSEGYEWRWRTRERSEQGPRPFRQPAWDGRRRLGGRLIVWGEQGVGDQLMFASLLPELEIDRGYLLECDARLVPLFARSLSGAEVVARSDPPASRLERPDIAAQVAGGSLMRWLRPSLASFRGRGGAYLRADPKRREQFRARYAGAGPVVGIAWHTEQAGELAVRRRIDLAELVPVLRVPGIRFVSVQYGDRSRALAELATRTRIEVFQDSELDQRKDLDGFAAQVAALDLVITIDNSAAHMAGALGIPCWILLPFHPEWRWQLDREDCIWWPSLRLFRQAERDRWQPVIAACAGALAARASGRSVDGERS